MSLWIISKQTLKPWRSWKSFSVHIKFPLMPKHGCLHWRSHSLMLENYYGYPFIWTASWQIWVLDKDWLVFLLSCMHWLDIDWELGNKQGWFKINGLPHIIAHKQLFWDVQTQWDSTYYMIKWFVEMWPVKGLHYWWSPHLTHGYRSGSTQGSTNAHKEQDPNLSRCHSCIWNLHGKMGHSCREEAKAKAIHQRRNDLGREVTFVWIIQWLMQSLFVSVIVLRLFWERLYIDVYFLVLHPSYHFSYIANNWEDKYKESASQKIKLIVHKSSYIRKKSNLLWLSLVSLAVFGSIWLDLKIWKNAEKS